MTYPISWDRYKNVVKEFDLIFDYAKQLSDALVGEVPPTPQHRYAAELFIKLLAHCATLRGISPDPTRQKTSELWDLPSVAAIARCVIESFDAMAYIASRHSESEEKEFRVLLWELHDSNRRFKMLSALGITGDRYFELVTTEQQLHARVVAHPHFTKIGRNHQKKIEARDPPESYVSLKDQCASNGVSHSYYLAVTMHLSQFVHSHPFALHQLSKFQGGSTEALDQMSLPIQYAMAFLSRAIEEWRSIFLNHSLAPSETVAHKIKLWIYWVSNGTRAA